MSPPIWMFVLVNSGIHAMMYTYYTVSALGFRVPNAVKRTLTSLQITQFLVGSSFAAIHLFVSYTVPVSVAHQITEKIVASATPSSVSSIVASATSSVAAALPTATGAAIALLRKILYRASGDEGLAENIAVAGHPVPHYLQEQHRLSNEKPIEHPIERIFHNTHKTVNRVVYRTEYQAVPCIDTSGQAFAIYLNLFYLAPLTILFMRFFFKSYLRGRTPNDKSGKPKRNSFSKATRDASEEVKRELESLDRAAEDGISSAVHRSSSVLRGRKSNINGIAKDERHGSLSPANRDFIDSVTRKSQQRLKEMDAGARNMGKKAKSVAEDLAAAAAETKEKIQKNAPEAVEKTKQQAQQAKDTAVSKGQQASETAAQKGEAIKEEANNKASEAASQADKTEAKAEEKTDDWQAAGSKKENKKSKLPQKKKERKETEESGVLVKKEDATDEEVQKPEAEPEPKDVNNTLKKSEGQGLF